ncbi:MAG: hydrogen gas-evolving membrane-bound hydrogenase subunit E [Acidimicrobiales bacterium]
MIVALLALHVAAIPAIALAANRLGRRGLLIGAVPTLTTALWAAGNPGAPTASASWVRGLDLSLTFQLGPVARLMTLLVGGIGALVFVYAHGYFSDTAANLGRFGATLMAFTTSMLGLVWADSAWTLFIFWEATSITSFLLVGFKNTDSASRTAARRALTITVAGGLALLAGLVVLVDATGTDRLSEMAAAIANGAELPTTSAAAAAALIVVGAATKSAQFPFHVWLPGAMSAPTPVSAFLHSATMVKAGVLLLALTAPMLASSSWWTPLGLFFGGTSMLWGAIGALRHHDAKLILAWGTVSQLGLLVSLLAIGTAKAAFAAISLLFAHAIFKAALFMVVGEIDVRTGTRNITELRGLARSMPLAFATAVAAGASMAGVPPLLGFAAKEAAVEAIVKLEGAERLFVGGIVVGGSVLTVAYTVRFLLGVFGPFGSNPGAAPTPVQKARPTLGLPSVVLGATGVIGYLFLGVVNDLVSPAAVRINAGADVYSLYRWPGLTVGLALSVAIVAVGSAVGWSIARRSTTVPRPLGASLVDASIDEAISRARRVTGRVQHGSLPLYVATMASVAALATTPFLWSLDTSSLRWWDLPVQGALALAAVGTASTTLLVTSRLGAALALGSVGIAVSGLFVVHGAPDLVLTQLLVETVVVVGFVVGLGHLDQEFPRSGQVWRTTRVVVSGLVGGGVAIALAATATAPTVASSSAELADGAVNEGGGNNLVNVILTDLRALDTVGEVVVLAVVALGVLALARPSKTAEDAP